MSERGKYIVGEGGDGTGKSTQIDMLQNRLAERGIRSIQVHEPDGFAGDETLGLPRVDKAIELRKLIKDGTIERTPWQNVLWFTEARMHNWREAMSPALKMGIWVLAARNVISTEVYQGIAEGVPLERIQAITREQVGEEYLSPDLTVVFSTDQETRAARIAARGELEKPDTFEMRGEDFQGMLNTGYLTIAEKYGYPVIDASRSREEVAEDFWRYVEPLID